MLEKESYSPCIEQVTELNRMLNPMGIAQRIPEFFKHFPINACVHQSSFKDTYGPEILQHVYGEAATLVSVQDIFEEETTAARRNSLEVKGFTIITEPMLLDLETLNASYQWINKTDPQHEFVVNQYVQPAKKVAMDRAISKAGDNIQVIITGRTREDRGWLVPIVEIETDPKTKKQTIKANLFADYSKIDQYWLLKSWGIDAEEPTGITDTAKNSNGVCGLHNSDENENAYDFKVSEPLRLRRYSAQIFAQCR